MNGSAIRKVTFGPIVAVLALAATPVLAQAPQGGPPPGMGPGGMGPGGMGMMGGQMDRAGVEQRLALDAAGLNLSADQKAQIDKLVDAYIAEQGKLRAQHPMTPGTPPSQEMMTAMRSARENLNAAVGKVMNDKQRSTWEAALATRRPMGPQGGPMGPPGNRPMGPPPSN